MVDHLKYMVDAIVDWLSTRNGTPDYWLPAQTRDDADTIANEISARLNLPTKVIGPKATCHSEWAVIIDRPKEAP